MKIQQLRHLLAAAESTSYVQAAKKCFTSRQNIAHSIRALEDELGVPLFERKGNEIALTPAGQQVVRSACSIVADVDELSVMLASQDAGSPTLTLAISNNIFDGVHTPTRQYLSDHADELRLMEVDCEECHRLVCMDAADVALVMCMERQFAGCSAMHVASSPTYAVVRRTSSLAKRESISSIDLLGHRLLLMSDPPFQYAPLFGQLEALGFDLDDVNIISGTSSMSYTAQLRNAVGFVSGRYAAYVSDDLVTVPVADSRLDWHFYLLYHRRAGKEQTVGKLVHELAATFDER